MKKQIAAACLALSGIGVAAADDLYAGVDYLRMSYEEKGISSTVNPDAIQFRLGTHVDPAIALEARVALGLTEGNYGMVTVPGVGTANNVKIKVDSLIGGYIRAELPVTDMFKVYGIAGVTGVRTSASANGVAGSAVTSQNGTEFSYGAGMTFKVSDTSNIQAEYMQLVDNDQVNLSSLNIGVNVKF